MNALERLGIKIDDMKINNMRIEEVAPWEEGDPGSLDSVMLKKIKEAGFNVIAVTMMVCEETFVFKTDEEATKAWEQFSPYGWWYGLEDFKRARKEYMEDLLKINPSSDFHPIYWV